MIIIAKSKSEERFTKTWDGRLSRIMRDFSFSEEQRKIFINEQKLRFKNTDLSDDEKYRHAYNAFKPMLQSKLNNAHVIEERKEKVKLLHDYKKSRQKIFVAS